MHSPKYRYDTAANFEGWGNQDIRVRHSKPVKLSQTDEHLQGISVDLEQHGVADAVRQLARFLLRGQQPAARQHWHLRTIVKYMKTRWVTVAGVHISKA